MNEISPFLHRQEQPKRFVRQAQASDYVQKDIDLYKSRILLEKLRYKRLYQNAVDIHWRFIQRVGDWWRKWLRGLFN